MSRTYRIGNCDYPSVTSLISTLSKGDQLLTWASSQALDYVAKHLGSGMPLEKIFENAKTNHVIVMNEAAAIGTEIHNCIEKYTRKQFFDYKTLTPPVKKAFFAFLDWRKKYGVRFLESEKVVFSRTHFFAGTVDSLCEVGGRIYVTDWKSSNNVYPESHGLQLSAYREALREMGVKTDGQIIVRLDKNTGKYETHDFSESHEKYLNAFLKLTDMWYSLKSRRLEGNPRANSAELKARMVA